MRLLLAIVSVAICLVLLAPAVTGDDGFPLSSHPMYASARSGDGELITAEGFDSSGQRIALPIMVIANTDDPLIARTRMSNAAASGRAEAVCLEIEERAPDAVVVIEVVQVRHDLRGFVRGDTAPLSRDVLARCEAR